MTISDQQLKRYLELDKMEVIDDTAEYAEYCKLWNVMPNFNDLAAELLQSRQTIKELQECVSQIAQGHKGYCGDHYVYTTQINAKYVDELLKESKNEHANQEF